MKHLPLLTLVLWLSSFNVSAAENTNQPLSVAELKAGFQMQMEIFVLDQDGKRLLHPVEHRSVYGSPNGGEIKIAIGNGSSDHNSVNIEALWKMTEDGSIEGTVGQYHKSSGETDNGKFEGLIKKENFKIRNMSAVDWRSPNDTEKTVIVRFTPIIEHERDPIEAKELPISIVDGSVGDNQGILWADRITSKGTYTAFTTHRGRIAMSFAPFKGAKEIGSASGNRIEINGPGSKRLTILSVDSILPSGVKAKVYGFIDEKKKSKRFQSLHTSTSSREDRFLKSLER